MENLRSKRRPVTRKDEVDEAIERMGRKVKFNPLRQHLGSWIALTLLVLLIWNFLFPIYSQSGFAGISQTIVQLAFQLAFAAIFALFQIYIMFFAIARPRTFWLKPGETGISFQDYKGNPQVLEMAREVVLLLKGAREFKEMGGEVIRGLLLEGDPGVGKSYLAQAIATEAGLPFGYCSAASLQSPFVAGGMLSIKALYKKANKLSDQYGACILFLDEIDAIGQKRAGQQQGGMGMGMGGMMGGMGSGLINELLVQMDPPPVHDSMSRKFLRWLGIDFKAKKAVRKNVLTIGATNLVETLDEALLRPGRFDRKIKVDLPDADGRREIIEYYLDKVNHENIPMSKVVSQTIGYTPVSIRYVINEAVVRAHFDGRDAITYKDILAARDLFEVGLRMPIRSMSYEEKRRIAYHEVGHAVAQVLLNPHEDLVKLTIIRHGGALGFMQPKPKEERYTLTKDEIEADIQVSLGSRAAEELFLNTAMTGFSGDLANATQRAILYCNLVGMNGHLSSSQVLGEQAVSVQEIEAFLQNQYRRVKTLLSSNADMCHALAEALIQREEMLGDEVLEIVNRFTAVLTNDARQLGFRLSKMGKHAGLEQYGGMYAEGKKAATGTDDELISTPSQPVTVEADEDDSIFPGVAAYSAKNRNVVKGEVIPAQKPISPYTDEDDFLPSKW
ncbi:AAA family ATPase [Candidatus Chlorohelix sp.]|uniref:AAA family ATPase n=1 Tax=Candidatus Chlorohelix sp. TaxID=3139201 RepID=UPI00305F3D99